MADSPIVRAVRRANPFTGSPASTVETVAVLDSFAASLMPRTSLLQGVVTGTSLLAARAVGHGVERLVCALAPADSPLPRRVAVRGTLVVLGSLLARLPERRPEPLLRSGTRSAGLLLRAATAGGLVHDVGGTVVRRYPAGGAVRPVAVSGLALAGVGLWADRRLQARESAVTPWPREQRNALPGALGTAAVVATVGQALGHGVVATRGWLHGYLGPGPGKAALVRLANAGLWSAAATTLYQVGVNAVGRANERVEPAYASPPTSPLVSGGPDSHSPFADLGQQGRRFVLDVVTPELVADVLGESATATPVRAYVGFDSEPLYQSGRAEIALAEMERAGAFDRSHLLLVCPTGTGWVNQTMIEAAELLTRGDLATACIQYGRYPSFLSLQKVALGRGQFRLLLWGVRQRLAERPPERRPRVLVYGESLGAWASSDVVMDQGVAGFDHYGIDRALWVGLPWLAKWSRSGMARGASHLVPPGTVAVVDRHEQLAALDAAARERLRAVVLSHDNDPIGAFGPDLLIQRPPWLAGAERGRGVPAAMRWTPLVTFLQTAVDAANAMVVVPGDFRSYGHDYRADMARVVADAFALPAATEAQLQAVEATLRRLDTERAARLAAAVDGPAEAGARPGGVGLAPRSLAGVPLRTARPGRRWHRARPPASSGSMSLEV